MLKKLENEYICKNTLQKVQEEYKTKLTNSLVWFLIFLAIAIWVYNTTSGILSFFAVSLAAIPVLILFFPLLSNYSKWEKFENMNQKQFLELQMKAKRENEEIAKREMEAANAVKMYRQMNSAYKLGQFLASLFYG